MSDATNNENDRDVVVFQDEDGTEIELDVVDYFTHKDQEYAVLMDLSALSEDEGEQDEEQDVYIMKVVVTDETEEFLPVDDELMEELSTIVEQRLFSEDEEDEKDEE